MTEFRVVCVFCNFLFVPLVEKNKNWTKGKGKINRKILQNFNSIYRCALYFLLCIVLFMLFFGYIEKAILTFFFFLPRCIVPCLFATSNHFCKNRTKQTNRTIEWNKRQLFANTKNKRISSCGNDSDETIVLY